MGELKDDGVLGEDGLRLLDVLLEEELVPPLPSRRRVVLPRQQGMPQWLAAALLLLGMVVVFGVATLHDDGNLMAPVQEPPQPDGQEKEQLVPFDEALLTRVERIRVAPARTCLRAGTNGYERDAAAVAEIAAPDQLQQWRAAVRESRSTRARRVTGDSARGYMDWILDDGRVMSATHFGSMLIFHDGRFEATAAMQQLLLAAMQQARHNHGEVDGVDELRDLPANATRLRCVWPAAGQLRTLLPRLATLRELVVVPPADDARDAGVGAAAAACATLQRLDLPVGAVDAEALQALARLPQLRALTLRGELRSLPADAFAAFANLQELRLPDSPPAEAQLRDIGRLRRLQELWLCSRAVPAAAVVCVQSLPALRRLALCGDGGPGAELVGAASRTHVEQLALRSMVLADADVKALALLPTLRVLDLRGSDADRVHVESMMALGRLQRVYVVSLPRLAGAASRSSLVVQLSMGDCQLVQDCVTVALDAGFACAPSWCSD